MSRLAVLTGLTLSEAQVDILADVNAFNLEGRYPDALIPIPSPGKAQEYLHRAEEMYQWLMKQLSDQ